MKNLPAPAYRRRVWLGTFGGVLVLAAIWLAVSYEFKHFYEALVVGLAVLQGAALGAAVSRRTYLISFAVFLLLGLFGDLFGGVFLTRLWHYNYAHAWEYLPLYLIVYPVAGIVMFQSYALVRRLFTAKWEPTAKPAGKRQLVVLILATALLLLLTIWWMIADSVALLSFNIAYITLLFAALFAYIARLQGKSSLVDDLRENPVAVGASLLAATYLNLLLHELPNTKAWEWVYSGVPWQGVQLLHIPIAVFPGWIALAVLPAAFLYAVRDRNTL